MSFSGVSLSTLKVYKKLVKGIIPTLSPINTPFLIKDDKVKQLHHITLYKMDFLLILVKQSLNLYKS